ncbi:MAG: hypothetical protein IKP92_02375 [Lachnospiraceae bacterium]|nr:hypothetical protein [Lachnospiraceae bacterium]
MKGKTCHTIAEITNIIMCTILCISLLYWGEAVARRSIGPFAAFSIGIVFVICYVMRMTVVNFILYAVLHIVPYGLLMLLPVRAGRFEVMGLYTLIAVFDFAYWMKRRNDGFLYIHLSFVLVNAVGYLYATVKSMHGLQTLLFVCGIVFFTLYYVRHFFAHAADLAKERNQDEKMPFGDMLANSASVAVPFVGLSVLVMVFTNLTFLDRYILAAYNAFMQVMSRILGFIIWLVGLLAGLFLESSESSEEALQRSMEQVPYSLFMEILYTILYICLMIIAAYLFIRLLIILIKAIPLHRNIEPTVIEESDMIEIREKIERGQRKKEPKLPGIRRRYKKTIERAVKKGYALNRAHTVRERSADLKIKRGEDIDKLSAEYEQARYSPTCQEV